MVSESGWSCSGKIRGRRRASPENVGLERQQHDSDLVEALADRAEDSLAVWTMEVLARAEPLNAEWSGS